MNRCPYPGGLRLSISGSRRQGLLRNPVNVAAHLLKNVAAHSNSIHAPAFCGGMDKYSPVLSDCKFAPARICPLQGRNPRSINRRFVRRVYFALKRRVLREGLAPSPETTRRHSPNFPEAVSEADFSRHRKAACLKPDISVSKQTATITPLFAALRLLFSLIMQALMPALNHAAFYGCPLSLFCSLSATLCSCFLKKWMYLRLIMAISIKIRLR